jgi:hypothetical protein
MASVVRSFALSAFTIALALIAQARCAAASTVIDYISFSASGFQSGAPVSTVSGSFALVFDPSQPNLSDTTYGLTMISPVNLTLSSPIGFRYDPNVFGGLLVIGGTQIGTPGVLYNDFDFYLTITNYATQPVFGNLLYSQGTGVGYSSYSISGTVQHLWPAPTTPVATTPIPAALPLLASAVLALSGLGFWKRRATA